MRNPRADRRNLVEEGIKIAIENHMNTEMQDYPKSEEQTG